MAKPFGSWTPQGLAFAALLGATSNANLELLQVCGGATLNKVEAATQMKKAIHGMLSIFQFLNNYATDDISIEDLRSVLDSHHLFTGEEIKSLLTPTENEDEISPDQARKIIYPAPKSKKNP